MTGAISSGAGDTTQERPSARKVALASSIGAAIEWYDFFIYGTAAGLVFNKLYFPNSDPAVGTLLAFTTFAVGFLARPAGSLIFGHFGDRIGRKKILVLTLLLMGIGTAAIGLIPTYDSIGIWAPILLVAMRLLQGLGIGGEYGGAVLMAVEYAPSGRRGFYGSWPQAGVPAGLLLASATFALLSLLPGDAFLAWGWRIAFVGSLLLVAVGLYIRLQVLETPAFTSVRERQEQARVPVVTMLREQPRPFLLGMGTRWVEGLTFNAYGVLVISYIANDLGLPESVGLIGVSIASAIGLVAIPIYGALSDRVGRKRVFIAGTVLTACLVFPVFALIQSESRALIWIALAVGLGVVYSAIYAPLGTFWAELFDTRVRYTGVGSVYQVSGIFASGLTPLIGSALIVAADGTPWLFAGYVVIVAGVSLVCVSLLPETYHRRIMPSTDTDHAPA